MISQEQLQSYVRETLDHLYDHAFLETHPLAELLARSGTKTGRGRSLQRTLLDTIQELKPAPGVPYTSLAWRKYRYLFLRYAQVLSAPEIASDLGVGIRQSRRYAREALSAVSLLLWDRYVATLRGSTGVEGSAPPTPNTNESAGSDSNESASSLVDQELARMQARTPSESAPLVATLAGVVATARPLAERLGVGLLLRLPVDLEPVFVERVSFRHALLSLISLCVESGCSSLDLSAETPPEATEAVVMLHARPREQAGKRSEVLTGDHRWMMASKLVEQHGGRLSLAAFSAQEAVIELRLELAQGYKVLVVEDNLDVVQLYSRYLGGGAYRVLTVANGSEALDLIERDEPAVVVLDVMMPGRDGWEILQHLKSNPRTQDIPVIVCSVLRERELALALGAREFLAKPIAKSDLLRALECILPTPRFVQKDLQTGL